MKKILSFVMLIIFIVFAVGCDPKTFYFDVDLYGEQIEKIELRFSELNGTPKIIEISDGVVPEFHLDETYLVEALDAEKNMAFCNDFALLPYHDFYDCVNKPFGYILVMYLSNGNYIVKSITMKGNRRCYWIFAEFSADEEFIQCFGRFGDRRRYNILLAKYFSSYPYEAEE
ncbi:MAG: hypothetical protein SO373_08675 [Candidatus Borkfalkiaceae bacterium]|nr:hypothetical protein [Christensenellaceae bacterium]